MNRFPPPRQVDPAVAAAREAKTAGAVVMVNASPGGQDPSALAELAELADVVIANEAEAAELPWRPTHLVTTLGARGARCVSLDDEFWVPAPAVKAVHHVTAHGGEGEEGAEHQQENHTGRQAKRAATG